MADGNGWSAYEKLVLTQIDELKAETKETRESLGNLATNVALLTQSVGTQNNHEERIAELEIHLVTEDKLTKERRWIYGAALAVLGSIIIPALSVAAITGVL